MALPFWRAYVHLYLPFLSSACCILIVQSGATPSSVLAAAIPWTYLIASFVYGDRTSKPQVPQLRFTQQHILYRILVLFSYGRILGSPFNIVSFAMDCLVNWKLLPFLIREDVTRSSHFLIYSLWTAASGVIWSFSGLGGVLGLILGSIDRTLWRASYLALVDDLVVHLGNPETVSLKGKLTVLGLQAILISLVVSYTIFKMTKSVRELRPTAAEDLQQAATSQEVGDLQPTGAASEV